MRSDTTHLLRIYTDATSVLDGKPYWAHLLDRAATMGVVSGSALKVLDAFGSIALVHGASAKDLAPTTHVVVELMDSEAVLQAFRDTLEVTVDTGLVTLEAVGVVGYGGHHHASGGE